MTLTRPGSGDIVITYLADNNNQIIESNERNNQAAITVRVRPLPDLTIQVRSPWSPSPVVGVPFEIIANVCNRSEAPVAGETRVSLAITERNGPTITRPGFSINSLAEGQCQSLVDTITLPRAVSYTALYTADSGEVIVESNELNNTATVAIFVESLPDLAFNRNLTAVVRLANGQFQVNLCNYGTAQAGQFAVLFNTGGGNSGSQSAGPIAPNACVEVLSGGGYIQGRPMTVTLDAFTQVRELNENNNQITIP